MGNWRKVLLSLFITSNIFLLTACDTTGQWLFVPNATNGQKYDTYTVRKGDTLKKISAKFAVTEDSLMKSNKLSSTTGLRVGQTLVIPAPAPSPIVKQQPVAVEQHSLFWPATGKVVRVFSKVSKGSKGIDIAGGLGQDIQASGGGKVVYSGASLSGFGNMVIIKHSDKVVTVYALNKKVLVKEGQVVKAGEKIAEMGSNKQGDVLLHFEVRIDGTPQDPLLYLTKK